jgi:hypothetical protein
MFQYKWNEIISHFIGIFEVKTEEARLRAEYEKFKANGAGNPDQPDLPLIDPDVDASLDLGEADAGALRLPFGAPTSPTAKLDGGARDEWAPMEGTPDVPTAPFALGSSTAPFIASTIPPYGETDGPRPEPRSVMPEPDGPTRTPGIGEGGSSVAVVAFQSNLLHDDDVLVTSGASVDFMPPAQFAARLDALADAAHHLDPLDTYAPPSSDAAIAEMVAEIAGSVHAHLEPAPDAGAPVADFRDDAAQGVRVDGTQAEALPDWRDHLPSRLAPPEPDENRDEVPAATTDDGADEPEDADEDPGAAHQLNTGSNTLVNETAITTDWGDAQVMAVMGDSRTLDVISQVNVWSDTDRITGIGLSTPETDTATVALNSAAIVSAEAPAARSPAGEGVSASWSQQWPQHWLVDRMDGDLVNLNWARQTNYVTDHDVTSVAVSGNQTWIQTGGNDATNAFSAVEISRSYDLIVAEGDLITANVIRQMNVLLDDDRVEMDALYSGMLSTRDNLLMNRAEINKAGVQAQREMADSYKALAEDLRDGVKDILADAAFEGLSLLRILHVGGDILNLQYIEQTNVLGDADQVTLAAGEATADAMADVAVSTGANALLNLASIRDARGDAEVHVRGEIYTDALLHQASLVSETDPELSIGNPTSMATEAVAFLADGMLSDDGGSGPDARPDASHDWDSPDVMQTMLS